MTGAKRKRAYGRSCVPCREKKISCDGVRPRCGGCQDQQETCIIPTSARPLRRLHLDVGPDVPGDQLGGPSNHHLAQQLQKVEERLRQVEAALHSSPSNGPNSNQTLSQVAYDVDEDNETYTQTSPESEYHGGKYRFTSDEAGNVIYHGLTSWSQGPNVVEEAPVQSPPPGTAYGMTEPEFAPIFQALASSHHISVAPALGDALLETFFCYQVFNIIQRSTFLRDMALGGPMFSKFLLMSMYASATRMIDGLDDEERKTQGALFETLAKEYLAKEMDGTSTLTTIQGLLLLSGRACALGNLSQGWNHAGLAFRMIHDLGIHLDIGKVVGAASLSYEEQATRERVFWAAFIWDKSISLAMGREPSFPPRAGRDPSNMADFDDDEEQWTAYVSNPLNMRPQLQNYTYQPKRRVATFRYLAQLCTILHHIIIELYSTESHLNPRQRKAFIHKTRQQMDSFWASVPDNMKFSPSRPSPPPWIFMLQMLYHATAILLHRVLVDPQAIDPSDRTVGICLEHTNTANAIAVSFTETFGDRLTYAAIYSSFVAASFDIMLLEARNPTLQHDALVRLRTWLGLMEKSVVQVPSIRRSVHHISESAWRIVSKHPSLMITEAGQWIDSLHSEPFAGISPASVFTGPGTGVGAFDFFELFEPI